MTTFTEEACAGMECKDCEGKDICKLHGLNKGDEETDFLGNTVDKCVGHEE